MFIPVDMKVIEGLAASVARGAGVNQDRVLAGLVRMWHRCWADKTDHLTREHLAGVFGAKEIEKLISALITSGFLEATGELFRVRGAKRFLRLRTVFSEAGKAGRAKQLAREVADPGLKGPALRPGLKGPSETGPLPEIPRSRDPDHRDPDHRDPEIPTTARSRDPSKAEECWTNLETDRLMRCEGLGIDPGAPARPKAVKINSLFKAALETARLADIELPGGEVFTPYEQLERLFTRFLADERFGRYDKDEKPRDQPWPIALFLTPGVLARFKREADTEDATGGVH